MQRLRVRDGYFRDESGKPVYLIGANFWPKRTGPWMFRDPWDQSAVGADLAELAALGANAVRIFCFWPDCMPASDVVSEQSLERLASTIDLAARAGLWSIPTFLVGHMSGENWEASWCGGGDWYTDPVLLDASELFIRTVAARFAADPRIAAWLLSNEWPLFAGRTSNDNGLRWAKRLSAALRNVDPGCNLSLGDGAWDVVNGEHSGLPTPALGEVVDFFGPHFYPKETDAMRHSAFASFAMRMLQPFKRPVLLEEFGCSSDQADDEFAAAYYRTVLWSAFGAGNCGALFWNSHDFTVADRPPYSHHPYELHFGVVRVDGSLKPQAHEVRRFAAFAAKHDPDKWEVLAPSVAIARTSFYLENFPFDWGWSKPELRDLYLQAYAACLLSGIDAGVVDLASAATAKQRLLLIPCMQQVTTQDVAQLERFVHAGGSVYLSYGGEPWFPDLGEFIGARPLIHYGLVEEAPREQLLLTFARGFGDIAKGARLTIPVHGSLRRLSPLRCEPREAQVIATDGDGNPALLERQLGAGRVIFMTHPIEYYALSGVDANSRGESWKLYHAVAAVARAIPAIRPNLPQVQTFVWLSRAQPSRRRILLVNHAWREGTAELLGLSGPLSDVESGERCDAGKIVIAAKGVRLLEATSA